MSGITIRSLPMLCILFTTLLIHVHIVSAGVDQQIRAVGGIPGPPAHMTPPGEGQQGQQGQQSQQTPSVTTFDLTTSAYVSTNSFASMSNFAQLSPTTMV